MDRNHDHQWEARDPSYRTGAVEDGGEDMIAAQILPVWATTEPFGYEGDPADLQVSGKEPAGTYKGHARRDIIGPGAS